MLKCGIMIGYYGSSLWGREIGKEKATKYEGTPKKMRYGDKGVRKFPAMSLSQ